MKIEEEYYMNSFTYSYPVKVYFGEKAAEKNLAAELAKVGKNVHAWHELLHAMLCTFFIESDIFRINYVTGSRPCHI